MRKLLFFSLGMSDDLELALETYEKLPELGTEVGLVENGLIHIDDMDYELVDLAGTGYRVDEVLQVSDSEYHIKLNPLASAYTIQ